MGTGAHERAEHVAAVAVVGVGLGAVVALTSEDTDMTVSGVGFFTQLSNSVDSISPSDSATLILKHSITFASIVSHVGTTRVLFSYFIGLPALSRLPRFSSAIVDSKDGTH